MSGQRLLQFRAGRALRQGDSNTVTPQPDRGLVYIQEEEDGLLHFCYKDLATGQLEDDLIIFPGDASFHDVTDRVQVLKFNSSSARHFYWHQDPQLDPQQFKRTRDEVNRLIGAADDEAAGMDVESSSGSATTSAAAAAAAAAAADVSMSDAAQPPTTSTSSQAPAATQPRQQPLGQAEQFAQLQNILAGLGRTAGGGSGGGGGGGVPEYTLTDVLTPNAASSLISSLPDSALSHLATSYLPPSLLPTTSTTTSSSSSSPAAEHRASLLRAVSSPEFRRSLASLERALRTGATGPLVQGLGMPLRAANGTEEFLEEVQKQAEKEKEKEGEGEGEAKP